MRGMSLVLYWHLGQVTWRMLVQQVELKVIHRLMISLFNFLYVF